MNQTGRTTKQMLKAPQRAIYVWPNHDLEYPKQLAKTLNRTDLIIVGPSWLQDSTSFRGKSYLRIL
jgi:hypothetical protein